ncbi:hypothetical protein F511_16299 [Dorcoceras hygrometricum]|uniref:Splicing factor 3B subunit 1-like n=1 Tax=Dorcoceras hygrometricum TaxID=472368 RepID=A0A2Z7D2W0_9LAMI|nr:hypothetical protein F511_16299 [Dorcoceras hygrometricum]
MVQVRQLMEEQQVKLETSSWVALCLSKAYVFRVSVSKTFPPLKILTVKTVGTYIAKHKSVSTYADEVADEPVAEKVVKAAAKRKLAPIAEPAAKKKRTTVGRLLAQRRLWQETTDKEESVEKETVETESRIDVSAISKYDDVISFKVLSNEEGPLVETEKKDEETEKEASATSMSDKDSMSIDDILMQIPEDMMLPSVTVEEPTKIRFEHGIEIKEVDWHKATLPKIDPMDMGKAPLVEEIKGNPAKEMFTLICADFDFLVQIWEAVVEEISSFFYSFSLRILFALTSISDLAEKEEQMLKWAETDLCQTAVRRRLYISAKYREMLLGKFLEARHNNF